MPSETRCVSKAYTSSRSKIPAGLFLGAFNPLYIRHLNQYLKHYLILWHAFGLSGCAYEELKNGCGAGCGGTLIACR